MAEFVFHEANEITQQSDFRPSVCEWFYVKGRERHPRMVFASEGHPMRS
jgi:hypothetical protein